MWVENGGIVGRGVLLDYAAWLKSQGKEAALRETTEITVSELDAVAAYQNISFKSGDILFIHTGFVSSLSALSTEDASTYAEINPPPAIGVKACEESLRWIWEKEFAAVAGDMPAFEALPFQSQTHWIHEWLLAGWGLPIGELFDLGRLAGECRRLKKWTFFFTSVPLNVSLERFGASSTC